MHPTPHHPQSAPISIHCSFIPHTSAEHQLYARPAQILSRTLRWDLAMEKADPGFPLLPGNIAPYSPGGSEQTTSSYE